MLLAVSNTRSADQSFIEHMDFLIANLNEWYKQNDELMSNVGGDVEDCNINLYKHYVLNKYIVDDIQNIPIELRCLNLIICYYIFICIVILYFWFLLVVEWTIVLIFTEHYSYRHLKLVFKRQ